MVFNEILIPQDSFTETNVTRKRSVIGNSHLSRIKKNSILSHLIVIYITKKWFMLENQNLSREIVSSYHIYI